MRVEVQVVLPQVLVQLLCAQYARNLHQLVVVVVPVEERVLLEDLSLLVWDLASVSRLSVGDACLCARKMGAARESMRI